MSNKQNNMGSRHSSRQSWKLDKRKVFSLLCKKEKTLHLSIQNWPSFIIFQILHSFVHIFYESDNNYSMEIRASEKLHLKSSCSKANWCDLFWFLGQTFYNHHHHVLYKPKPWPSTHGAAGCVYVHLCGNYMLYSSQIPFACTIQVRSDEYYCQQWNPRGCCRKEEGKVSFAIWGRVGKRRVI